MEETKSPVLQALTWFERTPEQQWKGCIVMEQK